jgi:hypothetical protein
MRVLDISRQMRRRITEHLSPPRDMDVAFGQLDRFVQLSHAHRIRSDFRCLDVPQETGQRLALSATILDDSDLVVS